MNDSQKSESNARQSVIRTTSKHDVNLRKNNVVFFQIGLIAALILAIVVLELKSPVKIHLPTPVEDVAVVDFDSWNQPVRREVPKDVVSQIPEASELLPPKVVENDDPKIETSVLLPTESNTESEIGTNEIGETLDIDEPESFSFGGVEIVPIFPGCEGLKTNAERKLCLQEKMASFINRNFDTSLGSEYGLEGINKVDVQFTIDEFGRVIDLKTRAPHPALEKEAVRIMKKLPVMQPGKQQNKNVRVIYYQPIRFKVQD